MVFRTLFKRISNILGSPLSRGSFPCQSSWLLHFFHHFFPGVRSRWETPPSCWKAQHHEVSLRKIWGETIGFILKYSYIAAISCRCPLQPTNWTMERWCSPHVLKKGVDLGRSMNWTVRWFQPWASLGRRLPRTCMIQLLESGQLIHSGGWLWSKSISPTMRFCSLQW